MAMGRPSIFTDDLARTICDRLAKGETLTSICKDEGMPAEGTVCRWVNEKPDFREDYARARDIQADVLAESIIDIADADPATFVKAAKDGPGVVCVDGAAVQHQKNRIEARKWYVGKVSKKYGDRQTVDLNVNTDLVARLEAGRRRVGDG